MQDGQESVSYENVPMAEIYHTSVLGNFLEDLKANWKTETQMTCFLVFPHCVKYVQIWSFFQSVFSRIRTE